MTAEIAILNRNAVALAADSAVTLQLPEGHKIYQGNKLFCLSKYHPVGVMVYGSADFMEVPWETIVKDYRRRLGQQRFPRISDYANDFLDYLENNVEFFPPERQEVSCQEVVSAWLRRLTQRLQRRVEEVLARQGSISDAAVQALFRQIVDEDIRRLRRSRIIDRYRRSRPGTLRMRYRAAIRAAITRELQQLEEVVPRARLEAGCVLAIMRDVYWNRESGIVIAGFGARQVRPSLRGYKLDTIIGRTLRVVEDRAADITPQMNASVHAFAQSEMVALFMNGVDSDLESFVVSSMNRILVEGYPSLIGQLLQTLLPSARRQRLLRRISDAGRRAVSEFYSGLKDYSREEHWEPIIDIVTHLPKEELAAMAEALVNLTLFKRHVTKQAETVGGPIDVAIISRGDGFIWIKRKHYFEPNLNPHFFSKYYYDTEQRTIARGR